MINHELTVHYPPFTIINHYYPFLMCITNRWIPDGIVINTSNSDEHHAPGIDRSYKHPWCRSWGGPSWEPRMELTEKSIKAGYSMDLTEPVMGRALFHSPLSSECHVAGVGCVGWGHPTWRIQHGKSTISSGWKNTCCARRCKYHHNKCIMEVITHSWCSYLSRFIYSVYYMCLHL